MAISGKDSGNRRGRARRAEVASPGVPYTMKLDGGRTLFVEVPGRMAVQDRGGEAAFTPQGVRFLDRIRALASSLDRPPSPAFITALREAAGLSQEELGARIGKNKLTVSRWERGVMRPGKESLRELNKLFARLKRTGVVLAG